MSEEIFDRYAVAVVCTVLVVAVLAVFGQVCRHEFINLDDSDYVTENEHVKSGLTLNGIMWAFTTFDASNWHPLTWISLMLDWQLFGLKAGGFHMTNMLLHMANTLLLFLVLKKMTGSVYRSGFVALFFAIHPLHVESVAWVAERKDVLSTLFWLLTMWAYAGYVRRGSSLWYVAGVLFFAAGLLAKPMLVTLPFVLLLLDYWPLKRLEFAGRRDETKKQPTTEGFGGKSVVIKLIWEKIPLFVLSAISMVITIIAQRHGGAVITTRVLHIGWRMSNAIVSYAVYIVKMFVPVRLAVFYPNMSPPSSVETIAAAMFLACITVGIILGAGRWKYLATGWLWYIGTLVPVIGIVQVGAQAYADRYTYVPLIGLFIIIAWLVPDVLVGRRYRKAVISLCTLLAVAGMVITATSQAGLWRNTIKLFEHTLAVTGDNCVAHNVLSNTYGQLGEFDRSIEHAKEALRIFPQYDSAHYNLGLAYYSKREFEKAIGQWDEVLRRKENYKEANYNIGAAFETLGETDKAIEYFRRELAVNPKHEEARQRLDKLLGKGP